ncbi:hypothetical protein RJ55_01156 [Drechmeria coniospora]|nr:hypothetical protein RJ55_01156 [Drechmeria coniospora]
MGCRVCRARKVKCDDRPEGCRNCERLQLDCVGSNGDAPSSPITAASLRKIRTYRSCQACRLSKTKCNGGRPKCARCEVKGAECLYDGGSAPRWTRSLRRTSKMELTTTTTAAAAAAMALKMNGVEEAEKSPQGPAAAAGAEHVLPSPISDAATSPEHDAVEHPLSWLLSPDLPSPRNLRKVVEQYFSNVHPLRCFAFVHKPSFMHQLDRGFTSDDESALLHVICAHGAKFLVLASNDLAVAPSPALGAAGNRWAERAESSMLANLGRISVQRLMTAILLHDFHFRLGEYGQALMISGLAVRMAHALKINAEHNADVLCADHDGAAPTVTSRESRRRLMWACYVLDAWAGSGVDQLTLLRESDIKIQLPSNERNFGLRIPSITETLAVGHVLQFLPPAVVPRRPAANMGIMAYYVRVVALWKRIVRYVNHMQASPPPWLPESPLAALDADLHLWRRELPDFVEYSTETVYARLDSNQLGALVLVHCTYHHNYLELYKMAMPDLFKLPRPFVFPPEHQQHLQAMRLGCFHHASRIAALLADAAEHGTRLLSDSLLPFFLYDSSRATMRAAVEAVESNNRVLRLMSTLFPIAHSLSTTIERWLSKMQQTASEEELVSSLRSEHRLEAHRSQMLNGARDAGHLLPPLHALAPDGSKGHGDDSLSDASSWSAVNPNGADGSGDGTSVALVGRHQEVTAPRCSLQHERPVPASMQPPPQRIMPVASEQPQLPMCGALDLDDLQSFLRWDMYGIMEIGGGVSNEDMDDSAPPS